MRNKAADIAWKFANRLREKYASQRVVTAMITYVYISWEAKSKKGVNDDPSNLINNALDTFGENFDEKQLQVFSESIDLLKSEAEGLFYDDFFTYLTEVDREELKELLAFLIKRTGEIDKELNEFTNSVISALFARTVDQKPYKKVLDPCIGSGQLLVELTKKGVISSTEVSIVGVEKNPRISLIAHVNLTVNGFTDFTVITDDILNCDFKNETYDLIISDLPLGVRLRDRSFGGKKVPSDWRFYHLLFKKCMPLLKNKGNAFCTSSNHIIHNLNNYCNSNQVEMEISPKNYSQYVFEIIDASKFTSWSFTEIPIFILSFKNKRTRELEISRLGESGEVFDSISIPKSTWFSYGHIVDPSFFLSDAYKRIKEEDEKNFIRLNKFFKKSYLSSKKDLVEKSDELFSLPINVFYNSSGSQVTKDELYKANQANRKKQRIAAPGSWILQSSQSGIRFVILQVDFPVLIPHSLLAIKPKGEISKGDKEWLLAQFYSSFVRDQINAMTGIIPHVSPKNLLEHLLLPDSNEEEKREFVNSWKQQRIEQLEEEQAIIKENYQDIIREEKQKRYSEEFDLIHDLHHTIKNDLSSIKGAIKAIENYLKQKEKSGNKVNLSEPIKQQRKGADPQLQVSVQERIDSLNAVATGMSDFINDFKTILSFDPERQNRESVELKSFFKEYGNNFDKFTLKVNEQIDELNEFEHRLFVDHYMIYVDREVFRLVFQNIIDNAVHHGFKEERKYTIQIEISEKGSIHDAFQYYNEIGELKDWNFTDEDFEGSNYRLQILIKNDGMPFPPDIDEENYFTKGKGGVNRGSGIGGYHIRKGIESLGGRVSLLQPDENDPFQVQLLIEFPIQYVESPNLMGADAAFDPDSLEN